jgi:hypothetical protein
MIHSLIDEYKMFWRNMVLKSSVQKTLWKVDKTLQSPNSITSQGTTIFIDTAIRISNTTFKTGLEN